MRPSVWQAKFSAAMEILDPSDEERERIRERAEEIRNP